MAETKTKRPRGRPPTGETPKRYFRMSDEEYSQVCQAAEKAGENISTYIRRVLLAKSRNDLKSK